MVQRPMLRMNQSAVYVAPKFILQGKRKFDSVDDCRYCVARWQDAVRQWDGWSVCISTSSADINTENSIQESPIHHLSINNGKSPDMEFKADVIGTWFARDLDFFIRVALKEDLLLLHISYSGRILLPLVQHSFPLSLTSWVMFSELIFRFIRAVFWPLALVCIPILCEGWIAVVVLSALCWLNLYVPSVGCQTKLKPEPNQTPRICPHCHNGKPQYPFTFLNSLISWSASVFPTKKNTWFELFFVPIIPLSRKHILLCMICGWQAALINYECVHWYGSYLSLCLPNHSQAPVIASATKPRGVQGWDVPNQTGYQPAYIPRPQKWSTTNSTLRTV